MKVLPNNKCSFWNIEKDSIFHYLWDCQHSQNLWIDFLKSLRENCENRGNLLLSKSIVLFGYDSNIKTDKGFDYVLLQAKIFVYKCRITCTIPKMMIFF